ncbi:MAG: hypothetical protein JO125_15775 [Chloroflexi bacterium]|nr:hypothetical protein [Chloroflexota bacterium]
MILKYLKISIYELYAAALIAFASGLRVLLAALGWPPTNADEGTMGIMALHVAYRGEHPLLFYGQNYMGSLEAYLGALFFHLLGPSLFALRLGVILLVTLFFISTYLLASFLYSKRVALVTLALLSIGSIPVFTRQIIATGGSSQTLLFGSLAFLLAVWLSYTYVPRSGMRLKLLRLLGYAAWGMVSGLGLWSDMVVLPFFAMAGLLLLVFCWRELWWAWVALLAGSVVGAMPSIYYNFKHGQNAVSTLFGLFHGSTSQAPHNLHGLLHGIMSTILISIPTATGSPFCPVIELPWLGDNSPHTVQCTLAHASWGLGYLALLGLALLLALRSLWLLHSQTQVGPLEKRQALVRSMANLMLLASAVLAIAIYSVSSAPTDWPGFHARYLVGLLIITPAILAPLCNATLQQGSRYPSKRALLSCGVFLLIGASFLAGTFITFSEVARAQAANQRQADLIHHLITIGATHIYTDYWTCNNLAFGSDERVICSVLDGNLQPSHNRVPHYSEIVNADPHAAYVFPLGLAQLSAIQKRVHQAPGKYRSFFFDGYVVYQK